MDHGLSVENPYASVSIPRAQLPGSFLDDTVLFNLSSCSTSLVQGEKRGATPRAGAPNPPWATQRISTQESWAQPYNPYASLKIPHPDSPQPFHWNQHKKQEDACCCCYCCCYRKCSPCCRKCTCVIS